MGSIHNELNRGSFGRAVKNALGVDTSEPGLERFSETLQPVQDIWRLPEWRLLRNEVTFARIAQSPAVAARLSTVQLINLAASRTLAVIEEITLRAAAPLIWEIAVEQSDGTLGLNITNLQGVATDTRYNSLGESSQLRMHTADVAVGIALPQWRRIGQAQVDTILSEPQIVMNPSSKLLIFAVTANTAFDCTIRWRERFAFPRELVGNP